MRKANFEDSEQTALFHWLWYRHRDVWELAYHIPNGGKRGKLEAARLKKQGVKAGYPDINIDLPRGGYHGLRIEFKATPPKDAAVSKGQREWIKKLSDQGYRACVCKGLEAAKQTIAEYLALG